jgi:hypothetical protein
MKGIEELCLHFYFSSLQSFVVFSAGNLLRQLRFAHLDETRLDRSMFPFKCTFNDSGEGNFHWMQFAPAMPNFVPLYQYVMTKALSTTEKEDLIAQQRRQ